MFKREFKEELFTIYRSVKNIDDELVKIKVAIHNLEKLGLDTKDITDLLDNVGIEFYKFKNKNKEILRYEKEIN